MEPCAAAAQGGHLSILKWLRGVGCEWDDNTTEDAARHGHLEILQWAIAEGCPCNFQFCMDVAYGRDHDDVVRWLREQTGYIIYDSASDDEAVPLV